MMNKILMVEQEIRNIQKAKDHLSSSGFEMISAFDGCHAFRIAKNRMPDLIITDAQIPVMSGYELCKAIKLDEDTKSIPIVVMTEQHRMEESFIFLGIRDFLNKPLCMEELDSVIRRKIDFSKAMELQKSKIFIHGKPQILTCCQELLKNDQHWIGYFSGSVSSFLADAIKYVPDVILLDLLMPEIPSDEMIQKIKSIPELKNTVILTYYSNVSISRDEITIQAQMIEVQYMKRIAQEAGATEYVGPFNPVTFMNLINIYRKDFLQ